MAITVQKSPKQMVQTISGMIMPQK